MRRKIVMYICEKCLEALDEFFKAANLICLLYKDNDNQEKIEYYKNIVREFTKVKIGFQDIMDGCYISRKRVRDAFKPQFIYHSIATIYFVNKSTNYIYREMKTVPLRYQVLPTNNK